MRESASSTDVPASASVVAHVLHDVDDRLSGLELHGEARAARDGLLLGSPGRALGLHGYQGALFVIFLRIVSASLEAALRRGVGSRP